MQESYRWAIILDRHPGVTPADLAAMTDWQIDRLYGWPRDKQGKLMEPAESPAARKKQKPLSVEQHVAAYLQVVRVTNEARPGTFPDDLVKAKVEEIRRSHATAE